MVAYKRRHSQPASIENTDRRAKKGKFVNIRGQDTPCIDLHHFQPNLVLIQQLHQCRDRLLIGD